MMDKNNFTCIVSKLASEFDSVFRAYFDLDGRYYRNVVTAVTVVAKNDDLKKKISFKTQLSR